MAKGNRNVAPIRLELLITIVDKKKADFYADLLQSFNVNMQIIVAAKGTAEEKMRRMAALSLARFATMALKPKSWMAMRGVMATMETMPKADSSTASPPLWATQKPITMGRTKLLVRGPLATPPESKAMAV